jgi:L-amino acid N-acyltransferase YncA
MSETALVRAAAEADLEAIAAIYGHHVVNGTASFETEAPSIDEIGRRYRDIAQRGLPYVVAHRDGEVLGFAYAGPYRPRPAYRFTVEDSVYIRPDCVGQGIGRCLLAVVVVACAEAGFKQMVAIIGDSQNTASIRLHQSAGFEHVGVLRNVGLKFDRWLDTVLMQKEL